MPASRAATATDERKWCGADMRPSSRTCRPDQRAYFENFSSMLIEQRARAPLRDQRDQPVRRILLRIDRQRALQQPLELRAVLRRDRRRRSPARRTARATAPFCNVDGRLEMFARPVGVAAERLGQAVERNHQLVQRALAPVGVERQRALGQRAHRRESRSPDSG